jgi:hypothetical protein
MNDYYEEKRKSSTGYYKAVVNALLVACAMAVGLFFTSCSTKQSVETEVSFRHLEELTNKMDSLFHSTSTWQQSIFEKQTALVDSFKNSEVRDTSHTVFLGEKGDTVKEIIKIKEIIEREHNTSEVTQESYQELFRQNEVLFKSTQVLQQKVDSLLHDHNKTTVVTKEAPWYQRWLSKILFIIILIMFSYIVYLRLFKKSGFSS